MVSIWSLASCTFLTGTKVATELGLLTLRLDFDPLPGRRVGRGVWKLKLFSRLGSETSSISASLSTVMPVILILGVVKVMSPGWPSSSLSSSSISSSASIAFSPLDSSSAFALSSIPSPPSNATCLLFLLLDLVLSSI